MIFELVMRWNWHNEDVPYLIYAPTWRRIEPGACDKHSPVRRDDCPLCGPPVLAIQARYYFAPSGQEKWREGVFPVAEIHRGPTLLLPEPAVQRGDLHVLRRRARADDEYRATL